MIAGWCWHCIKVGLTWNTVYLIWRCTSLLLVGIFGNSVFIISWRLSALKDRFVLSRLFLLANRFFSWLNFLCRWKIQSENQMLQQCFSSDSKTCQQINEKQRTKKKERDKIMASFSYICKPTHSLKKHNACIKCTVWCYLHLAVQWLQGSKQMCKVLFLYVINAGKSILLCNADMRSWTSISLQAHLTRWLENKNVLAAQSKRCSVL